MKLIDTKKINRRKSEQTVENRGFFDTVKIVVDLHVNMTFIEKVFCYELNSHMNVFLGFCVRNICQLCLLHQFA